MKKLLAIFLTALMLLGCLTAFAGCGDSTKEVAQAALDAAAEYLENLYKNDAEKTPRDYDVAGKVKIGDLEYTVTWEVNVEAVTIKESATAGFYTVDVPDETAEEIPYVLTATVKDADGNTTQVSFNHIVPVLQPTKIEEDKKIVLSIKDGDVTKYATGKHYLYTSASSGNKKWELEVTETKAEALAMTMKKNSDDTVSFVADGKYLFCDANNVQFVDEESDNTKFVLETATGGSFIKCAVANYGGKAQYLELYSGYITCYGMNDTNPDIYTFVVEDAGDAAGEISIPTDTDDDDDENNSGNTTTVPVLNAVKPVAGTAYKFAFVQGNKNTAYYLTGVLSGFYMASTETFADGVDYFVEDVTGGYNLYCMVGGAKKYVNTVVNGTHVNGVYEDAASTVYTYDEELKTLTTIVNEEKYVFGTKKDGTFTTLGPMKASTEPFYGVFVTEAATEEEVNAPEATESTIAEVLATEDGTDVIVKGVVSEIKTAWSDQYNNISVFITDGTNKIQCYRLATKVEVGDTVVVTGKVGSFNGEKQIAQGATAEVTKATALDAAVALADNTDVIVMGTVSEIKTAWSEQHGNISVNITDGTNTLYCYRLAANVEVGDIIVVTGKVSSYNNEKQIAAGATAVIIGKEEPEAPAVAGTTYTFANYTAGTQYAENEVHVLDEKVTVTTNKAHFTTQIRLYDNAENDGTAVFTLASAVKSFAVNAGNKAATLNVYGSTDGTTWTLIQGIETTAAYADHTVTIPTGTAYTYLKLDATGNQQIRVASVTIEFVA